MTATYDLNTDIGKVRLLIPDRDTDDPVFHDDEIEYFLSANSDNTRLAAAAALEIIAIDEALTFKVMKSGTDSVDGTKLADVLLKKAALLRTQATIDDPTIQVGVIETANGIFGQRQRLFNEYIRRV